MIETSTKYNRYAPRIPKAMDLVGSQSFDVQGRWDPFGQTEKGGKGVQKLKICHGCHKCMVPPVFFLLTLKWYLPIKRLEYCLLCSKLIAKTQWFFIRIVDKFRF